MPVMQASCPSCRTVLRSPQPLREGARVKCPKCATVFAVPGAAAVKPGPLPGTPAGASVVSAVPGARRTPALVIWGVCFLVSAIYLVAPVVAVQSLVGTMVQNLSSHTTTTIILPTTEPEKPPVDRNVPPAFTLSASDWMAEWKKDEAEARKKYQGKVTELTGEVRDFGDDPYGNVGYLFLKVEGNLLGVRCAALDKAPWLKVGPGCTVKVRGTPPQFGLAGDLFECTIVESSPQTALPVTAAELAQAFADDAKAAKEKYADKPLLITGEVASTEPEPDTSYLRLYLRAPGDLKVRANMDGSSDFHKKRNAGVQPGQRVQVLGNARLDDKEVIIANFGLVYFPR